MYTIFYISLIKLLYLSRRHLKIVILEKDQGDFLFPQELHSPGGGCARDLCAHVSLCTRVCVPACDAETGTQGPVRAKQVLSHWQHTQPVWALSSGINAPLSDSGFSSQQSNYSLPLQAWLLLLELLSQGWSLGQDQAYSRPPSTPISMLKEAFKLSKAQGCNPSPCGAHPNVSSACPSESDRTCSMLAEHLLASVCRAFCVLESPFR